MRIDCGPTWGERRAAKEQWHLWWAWHPVRVGPHDCRWLEWIDRKGTFYAGGMGDAWWEYEYRARPVQAG